jgi:hypothetical protein
MMVVIAVGINVSMSWTSSCHPVTGIEPCSVFVAWLHAGDTLEADVSLGLSCSCSERLTVALYSSRKTVETVVGIEEKNVVRPKTPGAR